MSISSQLLILNQTKQNVRTAINNKGVSVTDEAFAEYPDKVRLIPNGGGIYESNIIQYIEGTMTDVNIPYGTTTIAAYAFSGHPEKEVYESKVENVTIPNTVTSIGRFAFWGCMNIKHLTIPASVTLLGTYAFGFCTGLIDMTFLSTVPPTLETTDALGEWDERTIIYVPDESVLAYQTADKWVYISWRIKGISEKPQ